MDWASQQMSKVQWVMFVTRNMSVIDWDTQYFRYSEIGYVHDSLWHFCQSPVCPNLTICFAFQRSFLGLAQDEDMLQQTLALEAMVYDNDQGFFGGLWVLIWIKPSCRTSSLHCSGLHVLPLLMMAHRQMQTYNALQNVHCSPGKIRKQSTVHDMCSSNSLLLIFKKGQLNVIGLDWMLTPSLVFLSSVCTVAENKPLKEASKHMWLLPKRSTQDSLSLLPPCSLKDGAQPSSSVRVSAGGRGGDGEERQLGRGGGELGPWDASPPRVGGQSVCQLRGEQPQLYTHTHTQILPSSFT